MLQRNKKQASALIFILMILFVVTTMITVYVRVTTLEMTASNNFVMQQQAKWTSQGGINSAIAQLRRDFRHNLYGNLSGFVSSSGKLHPTEWGYTYISSDEQEDHVGDAVSLQEMQILPERQAPHPSYARSERVFGKKISGFITENNVYTLKILDTNSQINLNSQSVPLDKDGNFVDLSAVPFVKMIERLSIAIAMKKAYQKAFPGDCHGPFFCYRKRKYLGEEILKLRQRIGEFSSKYDILKVEGISPQKFQLAEDYITVHSPKQHVVARNFRLSNSVVAEAYRPDTRAPVNINTASWPVLVAIFWGLRAIDPKNFERVIEITQKDAMCLANQICKDRQHQVFTSWEQWKAYLKEHQHIFSGTVSMQEEKAEIIYANSDPNTILRRMNPDRPLWQNFNKTDLDYYTTELCFHPLGVFEIYSLAEVLDKTGNTLIASQNRCIAKIFSLMSKSTQVDFQTNQLVNSLETKQISYSEKADLHAFSHVNSLQIQPQHQESIHFGYVQPIIFDYRYGVNELDFSGPNGNLMFKCNFNKSLDADFGQNPTLLDPPDYTEMTKKHHDQLLAPNVNDSTKSLDFGDVSPDGIVFWESDFAPKSRLFSTLCYQANGNIPSGIGDEDSGTLMFWFKLNENQNTDDFKTVFLSTSVMATNTLFENDLSLQNTLLTSIAEENLALSQATTDAKNSKSKAKNNSKSTTSQPQQQQQTLREEGIQMTIEMRFNAATGTLDIRVRRKFYTSYQCLPGENPCPFQYADYTVVYSFCAKDGYGVKPHEWYHIAVRWRDGTDLELVNTNAAQGEAVVLSGNFYTFDRFDNLEETPHYKGIVLLRQTAAKSVQDTFSLNDVKTRDFPPINQQELGSTTGHFYVGAVPEYDAKKNETTISSMAMLLDDFRIVKGVNGISDALFNPSRYMEIKEESTSNVSTICKFNGIFVERFKNPVILGTISWTSRSFGNFIEEVPFLFSEDDYLGHLDTESTQKIRSFASEEYSCMIGNNDVYQLGVLEKIWSKIHRDVKANKFISLQDFINAFGPIIINIWDANRGDLDRLQDLDKVGDLMRMKKEFYDVVDHVFYELESLPPETSLEQLMEYVTTQIENLLTTPPLLEDLGKILNIPAGIDPQGNSGIVLGVDEQGPDNNQDGKVDDHNAVPVKNPGMSFAELLGQDIVVLTQFSKLRFQLRFHFQRETSNIIEPQFLSSCIDDIQVSYQDRVEYLELAKK